MCLRSENYEIASDNASYQQNESLQESRQRKEATWKSSEEVMAEKISCFHGYKTTNAPSGGARL